MENQTMPQKTTKKVWYKKWWVWLLVFLFIVVILSQGDDTLTSSITYETEGIPAKKAKYSEPFELTESYGVRKPLILACGDQLPNQELTLEYNGNIGTTIAQFQDVGAGMYGGKPLVQKQKFTCEDGKQLRIYNDSGDATITGEKELIQEATEAIPAGEITETYSIDNDNDSEAVCTSNGDEVSCDSLKKLEELKQDIEKQKD